LEGVSSTRHDTHRKRASVGVRIPVAARRLALNTSWCLGAL
jgi:hypothetical protein